MTKRTKVTSDEAVPGQLPLLLDEEDQNCLRCEHLQWSPATKDYCRVFAEIITDPKVTAIGCPAFLED